MFKDLLSGQRTSSMTGQQNVESIHLIFAYFGNIATQLKIDFLKKKQILEVLKRKKNPEIMFKMKLSGNYTNIRITIIYIRQYFFNVISTENEISDQLTIVSLYKYTKERHHI